MLLVPSPEVAVRERSRPAAPRVAIESVRARQKRHAIFVAAGDREIFATYALDRLAADFDLLIFFYGSSKAKRDRFLNDARAFASGAGSKFAALKEIFRQDRDLLLRYETVWVCDDDLKPEHGDFRLLPQLCAALNVSVLTPAHSRAGKISHPITLPRLGRHTLRYTSFVEMTCPLFRATELARFLDAYQASPGGYADDWWFLNVFEADRRPVAAIVDAVTIVNPHDRHKPGGYSEIEQIGRIATLRASWHRAMRQYGLREWPQRELFYLRPGSAWLASIGADPPLRRRGILPQLRTLLTELIYQLHFYGPRKRMGMWLRPTS